MLKAEEKAIEMYNKALGDIIYTNNKEVNKENAKEIVLKQLLLINEALINTIILDNVPTVQIKKTQLYYNRIHETIVKL